MRPNRARTDGVRRVTCVVKDNILHGCRLFVRVLDEIGTEYPTVEREVVLVDAFHPVARTAARALRCRGRA